MPRVHCIAGEGLWQYDDVLEVQNAYLAVLVEEEVVLVHVGLNEDELIVAETYLRWPVGSRDPFESLVSSHD